MDYNEVKVNLRKFAFPLSTENALNQIREYRNITNQKYRNLSNWVEFWLLSGKKMSKYFEMAFFFPGPKARVQPTYENY